MSSRHDGLRSITADQHGLVRRSQLEALGFTQDGFAHTLDSGLLEWCTPRVLRLRGAPDTSLQRLLLSVLDAGTWAGLSHSSGLAHWGVRGFVTDPTHVTRHRDDEDHRVQGTTVHEVRFLPRTELRSLEGVSVVSPALALLQLSGMRSVTDGRLERAIDAAWSDRLVSYSTLRAIDERMSRQGRGGLTRFRRLVAERGPAYVPPASNLESRFAELLARAGVRPMRRQIDCSDEQGWIGRVDFRDEGLPTVVEVQSERFHRGLTAERSDLERLRRLRATGFEVVEITDVDLFHRPQWVLSEVGQARARARRRLAA